METRMTKVVKTIFMGKELSIMGTLDEPLFRAQDVADWLSHTNPVQMLKNVPEREIKKIKTWNGTIGRWTNYLTEFGVYFVLMRSKKPIAEKYQYEIAKILKNIRLNGYAISENITTEQIASLKAKLNDKDKIIETQARVMKAIDKRNAIVEKADEELRLELKYAGENLAKNLFNEHN